MSGVGIASSRSTLPSTSESESIEEPRRIGRGIGASAVRGTGASSAVGRLERLVPLGFQSAPGFVLQAWAEEERGGGAQ